MTDDVSLRTENFSLLSDALQIQKGFVVALVGGGGKTGAMLTVSRELAEAGWRVVASTTTKVGRSVADSMPVLTMKGETPPEELARAVSESGRVFLSAGRGGDGKLLGVDPWTLTQIRDGRLADVVIVEADGARQMPLKAPGEHEPAIPEGTDVVSPVAGLDALGLRIEPGSVHRPEFVANLTAPGVITSRTIADVLMADGGGLKGVPPSARVSPILNKLDCVGRETALEVAGELLARRPGRVSHVLVTSLRNREYLLVRPR